MKRLLTLLVVALLFFSCSQLKRDMTADCEPVQHLSGKITDQSSIIAVGALISGAYLVEKASMESRMFPCSFPDATDYKK